MTKQYFTPIDFDKEFPIAPVPVKVPSRDPNEEKIKEESIGLARQKINEELQRVRTGSSKLVSTAQHFNEGKTPFCIALAQLPAQATTVEALKLIAIARQDFGEKFATFVLDVFKPIFGDK